MNITWDHANFVILVCILITILIFLKRHFQFKTNSKLCLEVTCGTHCILLDIIHLPMCPSHYEIQVPSAISDLQIKGHWYSPKLHISWPDFSIKNTTSDKTIHIKSAIPLNVFQARKLRRILSKPFFVYIYKLHHGIMIPIRSN